MSKKLYVVAGSRNLRSAQSHGGIFFNLGETRRSVKDRLSDPDYSRKAAGGEWEVLGAWNVPEHISDRDIHSVMLGSPILSRAAVKSNTEEFFAKTLCKEDLIKEVKSYIDTACDSSSYDHKLELIKANLRSLRPPKRHMKKKVWDEFSEKYKKVKKELEDYKLSELSFSELELLERRLLEAIDQIKIPSEDALEKATLSTLLSYGYSESLKESKENKLKEIVNEIEKRILKEKNLTTCN